MALGDNHPLWRTPRHHLDLPHAHDHVHWMELFYDLIHVVMIFMLGNFLAVHHDLPGFIAFALIFCAVWLAWGETSIYNSIYVSTDWVYRVTTAAQTLSVLFMAASVPALSPSFSDPGKGFTCFTVAYGFNRLILAWMYYRTIRTGAEGSSLAREQTIRFLLLAGIYFLAAFCPAPLSVWIFIAAAALTQTFYFIPFLTIMRLPRFVPRMGHFTERFALLLLIVNGEGFFKLVVTLAGKGVDKVSWQVFVNVGIGGLAVFVLTWIYFDFVGNVRPADDRRYKLYVYWIGHMVLMMAAVMIGVALAGEVYVGFMEPFPIYYGYFGCLGLLLYLLSLYAIKHATVATLAHRFASTDVLMFGVSMALVTLFVFPYVPAFVGNALWATALFSQLVIPITRAYFTLSREEAEASRDRSPD